MRSNRAVPAIVAVAAATALVAGCASETEVRLAEPELDFPYTSTTAAPAPTTTAAPTTEATSTSTSTTSSSSSTSSSSTTSTRTSTSTRTASNNSDSADTGIDDRDDEPAPVRNDPPQAAAPAPSEPGAACAWPSQGEAKDKEFSTFCDREWARTVIPSSGQQYFWRAQGSGWASIDPAGQAGGGVCWDPKDFDGAPEAVRKAAVFCEPE